MAGVTVAVVLYQSRAHLPHLLPALERLEGDITEVLAVDNASTDDTVAYLRRMRPAVRVIRLPENRGPGPARNRALRESRTSQVLLLDADAVPDRRCLVELQAALAAHPESAVAQARAVFDHAPDRVHYDGAEVNYLGLLTFRHFGEAAPAGPPAAVGAVAALALLVDRERLGRVLGDEEPFDPAYFFYFEDTDFSLRIRRRGGGLLVVPRALVRHRTGTAGLSYRPGQRVSFLRAKYWSRNRWRLLLKCFAPRTLLLTLPAQVAYEGCLLAFFAAQGQLRGWLAGKLLLARELPALLRERRRLGPGRRPDRELLGWHGLTVVAALEGGRKARLRRWLEGCFGAYWRLVRRWL